MPSDHMLVAMLTDIHASPHSGLVVGDTKTPCECVLTLLASTEKSSLSHFGTGFRVVTKNVRTINFESQTESIGDICDNAQFTSICTLENLTEYKLDPPKLGAPRFALAIIAGVSKLSNVNLDEPSIMSYMIDRIQILDNSQVDECKQMLTKLALMSKNMKFAGVSVKRKVTWPIATSPFAAAKARKLSACPTDASLES